MILPDFSMRVWPFGAGAISQLLGASYDRPIVVSSGLCELFELRSTFLQSCRTFPGFLANFMQVLHEARLVRLSVVDGISLRARAGRILVVDVAALRAAVRRLLAG